ncbi:MAG: sensor histidine kinase [Deltaproteobacteria bacterium]|nr:sensor histidine kinase [Deltaproteobacteria bacterium]
MTPTIQHGLELEPVATLPWLVRLRWSFLVGQAALLALVHGWLGLDLAAAPIAIGIGGMALSNVGLVVAQRRGWGRAPALIGAVMVLDTGLLTLLLMGSGGSANPFTVLYLVHITLSAIVLRVWWTLAIAALSLGGFGLLFATAGPHAMHLHGASFDRHLEAMWAAFAVAAVLIAFFVGRVTRAIARQRDQIASLRESNERNGRVASLTRLAAGAAHELGSPLGTIAVAAHEARRHAGALGGATAVLADLELITLEVERCQDVLRRMSARARSDEDERVSAAELADRIRDLLGEDKAQHVELRVDGDAARVEWPGEPLAESVAALVKNAIEASAERVVVRLAAEARDVRVEIADRGPGIPDEVLARIGEPFFTTKEPGRGMGLGVFLARAFLESRGGSLAISSEPGVGTHAVIRLPRAEVA